MTDVDVAVSSNRVIVVIDFFVGGGLGVLPFANRSEAQSQRTGAWNFEAWGLRDGTSSIHRSMETLRTGKRERFGSIDRTWCVVRGAGASPIRGAVVLSWVELGQRDVSAGGT